MADQALDNRGGASVDPDRVRRLAGRLAATSGELASAATPFTGRPVASLPASPTQRRRNQGSGTGRVYGRAEGEEVEYSDVTLAELSALAAEAHRPGRRVAAHALATEGIRNAVLAGADTVEHGTVLCPTTETYRRIAESATTGNAPAYAIRKASRVLEGQQDSLRMAIDARTSIIAGTGAGAPGNPLAALVDELQCLVKYGLSTHQALRAATSAAADAIGASRAGRIRLGAQADLVMVDNDSFHSVEALHHVWGVVRSQTVVRRR